MYVIIVGGGRIGVALSRSLIEMGHEVLLIERSAQRCEALREELGSAVMRGDGCEVAVLAEAGTERADAFLAVTEGDEDNLVAYQVAQHRFHVSHCVALVNNPRNVKLFTLLGIPSTVNVVDTIAGAVLQQVPGLEMPQPSPFTWDGLTLLDIRIPANSPAIGRRVATVKLPEGSAVALVIKQDRKPRPLSGELTIDSDDQVLVLARPEDEAAVLEVLTQ